MPTYKDEKRGTWYVSCRYADFCGRKRRHVKRGFKTQREAKAYERDFLSKKHTDGSLTFRALYELYAEDNAARCRAQTVANKTATVKKHILPYFGDMLIEQIKPLTVRTWQNQLVAKGLKSTTINKTHSILSSIFNFAVKFYSLETNPARECGAAGSRKSKAMKIWTVEQYHEFRAVIEDVRYRALFDVLFWTGVRIGEAMALTLEDFDFENKKLRICKTYSVVKGQHIINPPKTAKGNRKIEIPDFLCNEIKSYAGQIYGLKKSHRLFSMSKNAIRYYFNSRIEKAQLPKIRVHDLRHSHASYLISIGAPIIYISERLGHESTSITLNTYSHLYPTTGADIMKSIENGIKKVSRPIFKEVKPA